MGTRFVRWLLIAPLILSACGSRQAADSATSDHWDSADPDPHLAKWPWWPASARFHPLSRLVFDDPGAPGRILIEARCEFLDRDGSSSRACGRLRLDLHDGEQAAFSEPLSSWSADLRDTAVNTRHWDPVMRTYLLRLEVDPALVSARPALRLYFLSADGARITAEVELRRDGNDLKSAQ